MRVIDQSKRFRNTFYGKNPNADDQETLVELQRAGWSEGLDRLQRALTTVA